MNYSDFVHQMLISINEKSNNVYEVLYRNSNNQEIKEKIYAPNIDTALMRAYNAFKTIDKNKDKK